MPRKYELKRRRQSVEDTRRRIVEAALELHEDVGPVHASVSAIAERAGVQRQTFYRHFPDERSLLLACSGLYRDRNPLPDPDTWRAIEDPQRRLRHGLDEMYAFFAATEPMLASVTRDLEVSPLLQEVFAIRMAAIAELRDVLAKGLGGGKRRLAALDLALDFNTWRRLVRRSGLSHADAVDLMASSVRCAG